MPFVAILALGAALAGGNPDPRIGTWTLVSAQSTLDPANKLSITPVPNGVHLLMSGETHLDFTARSDGHGNAVPGNPAFNQIELHRISKRQSAVKEEKDGALVATVGEKLSNDGKELTITTVAQGEPDKITVWSRTGGAAVGKDLFAGEWTEDESKTRLRQGLVLKIEPDGGDGIRFSGGYSFTGRFDGKQYDLHNAPNDTVQLSVADAHTVDAVYRRDDQISQRDRWVVSADGKTLTLTSKGTLQTGQHLAETLVFKKQ
ncbi:MAG TPA: hypothetical protein VKV02_00540 [Acidobacteriaceae bacterium]|nr:hypothetical protein [Acidobacteriaceae bacterium]